MNPWTNSDMKRLFVPFTWFAEKVSLHLYSRILLLSFALHVNYLLFQTQQPERLGKWGTTFKLATVADIRSPIQSVAVKACGGWTKNTQEPMKSTANAQCTKVCQFNSLCVNLLRYKILFCYSMTLSKASFFKDPNNHRILKDVPNEGISTVIFLYHSLLGECQSCTFRSELQPSKNIIES